jgi:hypothetical protein
MSSLELTDEYFYYEQKLGFSCVPKGILFVCVSSRRLVFISESYGEIMKNTQTRETGI